MGKHYLVKWDIVISGEQKIFAESEEEAESIVLARKSKGTKVNGETSRDFLMEAIEIEREV